VHGLRCERWFFGTQRRADRRLEPIAKILRRPVIDTAILQREDNARPEIHPRLSVRGIAHPVGWLKPAPTLGDVAAPFARPADPSSRIKATP